MTADGIRHGEAERDEACERCGYPFDACADGDARALAKIVRHLDRHGFGGRISSSGEIVIWDAAPDSAEYGGDTQPGSDWDEACDALLAFVQSLLPPGWAAEWVDDDIHICPPQE